MSGGLLGVVRPHFQPRRNFVRVRVDKDLAGIAKSVVGEWCYTVRTVVGRHGERFLPLSDIMREEDVSGGETVLSFGSQETVFENAAHLQARLERELGTRALPEPLSTGIVLVPDPVVSLEDLPLALFTQLHQLGMSREPQRAPGDMGFSDVQKSTIVGSFGFSYLLDDRATATIRFPGAIWERDRGGDGRRFSLGSPGKCVHMTVLLRDEADRMRLEGWDYLETGIRHLVEMLGQTPFKLRLNKVRMVLEVDVPAVPEYDQTIPAELGLEPDLAIVMASHTPD